MMGGLWAPKLPQHKALTAFSKVSVCVRVTIMTSTRQSVFAYVSKHCNYNVVDYCVDAGCFHLVAVTSKTTPKRSTYEDRNH